MKELLPYLVVLAIGLYALYVDRVWTDKPRRK